MQFIIWIFSFFSSIWIVSFARYVIFRLWAYQFCLIVRQESFLAPIISMSLSFFAFIYAIKFFYFVTENTFLEFTYYMLIFHFLAFGLGGVSDYANKSTSSPENIASAYGDTPKEIVVWTSALTLAGNQLGIVAGFAAVYVERM